MCVCVCVYIYIYMWGFPGSSAGKESFNSWVRKTPEEGIGYPV